MWTYHSADSFVVAFITPPLANDMLCLFQDLELECVVAFSRYVFGPRGHNSAVRLDETRGSKKVRIFYEENLCKIASTQRSE